MSTPNTLSIRGTGGQFLLLHAINETINFFFGFRFDGLYHECAGDRADHCRGGHESQSHLNTWRYLLRCAAVLFEWLQVDDTLVSSVDVILGCPWDVSAIPT
jgi:hypothetical protein